MIIWAHPRERDNNTDQAFSTIGESELRHTVESKAEPHQVSAKLLWQAVSIELNLSILT
jgi:hypothetical protein